jgi:hypothetical protein
MNCVCQISTEDIQYTAKDLKLRTDCVGYVRLSGKFPGLIK